jgi:hypothetical protein
VRLRSDLKVLEREHAVKVEALCVLILLYIRVLTPLYMCPHRSEVAVLETEHAVKFMLLTKPLCLYATN